MLEQIAYESRPIQIKRQIDYFVVGDLESLSAGVLYTGEPCGGEIQITHGVRGMKTYWNGWKYHIFEDGGSHIDEKDGTKTKIKPLNGSNPKGYESTI